MRASKVWVIIPAHNEEKTILQVTKQVKRHVKTVLIIDDGSTDQTLPLAEKSKAQVLHHIINLGKGAALKTGCDYALRKGAEFMIVIDADGQHEPDDIPRFIKGLEEADVVLSYRKTPKNMPSILRLGNAIINSVNHLLFGLRLHDTQCGYRAFTRDAYRKIRWRSSSYSMESEMIAHMARKRLKYKEIPIRTIYGNRYKGTTIIDGFKIVGNMIWWRFFQ